MTGFAGIGDGRSRASSASSPPLLSGKRQGSVLKPVPALPLVKTNRWLRDPMMRRALLIRSVRSSSAIEGADPGEKEWYV